MLPKIKILDWNDIPERYNYRAQDADGSFFYYDGEPELDEEAFFARNCSWIIGVENVPNPDWKDSLEQRPVPDPIVGAQVVYKWDQEIKIGTIEQDPDNGFFYIFSIDGWVVDSVENTEWKYISELTW